MEVKDWYSRHKSWSLAWEKFLEKLVEWLKDEGIEEHNIFFDNNTRQLVVSNLREVPIYCTYKFLGERAYAVFGLKSVNKDIICIESEFETKEMTCINKPTLTIKRSEIFDELFSDAILQTLMNEVD